MLKLQPKATFWMTVSIPVPGDSKEEEIKVEVAYTGRKALVSGSLFEDVKHEEDPDVALAHKLVKGWKLVDSEFNTENLGTFLEAYSAAAPRIVSAYMEALRGGVKEKNSQT